MIRDMASVRSGAIPAVDRSKVTVYCLTLWICVNRGPVRAVGFVRPGDRSSRAHGFLRVIVFLADRFVVVVAWGLSLRVTRQLVGIRIKHNKGIWWMPWH